MLYVTSAHIVFVHIYPHPECCRGEFDVQDIGDRSLKFPIQNQAQSERSGHVPGGTIQSWCLTLRDEAERIIFKTAYSCASEYNAGVDKRGDAGAADISSQKGTENDDASDGSEDASDDIDGDASDDSEATTANLEPARDFATTSTNYNPGHTSASSSDSKSNRADDAISDSDDDDLFSLPETQDVFSQNRYFA